MTTRPRAAWLAVALAAGCAAGLPLRRLDPPAGERALGLRFGAPLPEVERALAAAGIEARPDPGDPDALDADRCPGAPAPLPCRLLFAPGGLYAAEQDVPLAAAPRLVEAVEAGLGPRRPPAPAGAEAPPPPPPAAAAGWSPPGWSVSVTPRPDLAPPVATLRAVYAAAAPPVVAGVPLGRRRADVERLLALRGATVLGRDDGATSYLACPDGDPAAISCTVTFRRGRAAAVMEVLAGLGTARADLERWSARAAAIARAVGRPAVVSCPAGGPGPGAADCTATWSSPRLERVVGARRGGAGDGLGVYIGAEYPLLDPGQDD